MITPYRNDPDPNGDDWASIPNGEPWKTWGLGLLLGGGSIGYGIHAIVTQTAALVGERNDSMNLHGGPAVAEGIAGIGLGLFFFCHYFIQNWRPMVWYAVLGKIIGLLSLIGGLGFILIRFVTHANGLG